LWQGIAPLRILPKMVSDMGALPSLVLPVAHCRATRRGSEHRRPSIVYWKGVLASA
jgi:hypothetical protein